MPKHYSKEVALRLQEKDKNGQMFCESIYHIGKQGFFGKSEMIAIGTSNPIRHCKSCANTRRRDHKSND